MVSGQDRISNMTSKMYTPEEAAKVRFNWTCDGIMSELCRYPDVTRQLEVRHKQLANDLSEHFKSYGWRATVKHDRGFVILRVYACAKKSSDS